jgi:DNA-binding transcriptional ArsR family regulator
MPNNKILEMEQFAELFKALSNPNRLRIFRRLTTCCKPGTNWLVEPEDKAYVGELGRDLGIAASTVSHHIKALRQAGIIRTRRQGQNIECWVDAETIEKLKQFFSF